MTAALYPAFLKLDGLPVVVVGGGPVAASKLDGLLAAGARVTVVAPAVVASIRARVTVIEERFRAAHLDGARWVVAAATPEVNREVAEAAAARGLFVNAVDDPAVATAYLGGGVRRGPVGVAVSTRGRVAPLPRRRRAPRSCRDRDLDRRARARARGPVARGARGDPARRARAVDRGREVRARGLEAGTRADGRASSAAAPCARSPLRGSLGMTGFVSLVGAGPGDPDLLTLRAVDRLRRADLVLYDALVEEELLQLAPQAKRFYVGKRAGRHSIDQDGIHRLMVRAAQRGERVVRLKCGDPFVLGRGGEEALALEAAGVAYEIVPGLSSAIAAPALAGIPVTHRGLSAGFAVLSGHAANSYGPVIDSLAPGSLTLVVLMGLRTRGELAERLAQRGWSPDTPAAVVLGASHEHTTRWLGTLATLATAEIDMELAGIIVVGAVVELATQIANDYANEPARVLENA